MIISMQIMSSMKHTKSPTSPRKIIMTVSASLMAPKYADAISMHAAKMLSPPITAPNLPPAAAAPSPRIPMASRSMRCSPPFMSFP